MIQALKSSRSRGSDLPLVELQRLQAPPRHKSPAETDVGPQLPRLANGPHVLELLLGSPVPFVIVFFTRIGGTEGRMAFGTGFPV